LKQLSQFQCGVYKREIVCVPFKRVFEECVSHDGKKTLYETTTADYNVGDGPRAPIGFSDLKVDILKMKESGQ
jgi:Mitochondrial export protein Som1